MEKMDIGTGGFVYPMPVVLMGATVKGRANFMAVGWVSRVNAKPPMIATGIGRKHYTNQGIRENKTFSINIPSAQMIEKTDYCGLVSGEKTDKSQLFEVFYGITETAPMIEECPLCMECRLVEIHDMPTNEMFIGEILATYTEERYLTDGKPDIKKIDPFVLTMPDNNFWLVGEHAGKAWSIGKALKK